MTVEVFFDFICPWCRIGKRNLEADVSRTGASRIFWRNQEAGPTRPAAVCRTRNIASAAFRTSCSTSGTRFREPILPVTKAACRIFIAAVPGPLPNRFTAPYACRNYAICVEAVSDRERLLS
ncbi:DsbA family protein [Caballeronia glathei]|uniref:DsbA family protein n=1 Tax=Caballeronia glathei TaxID=60547 RepID=UPI00101A446F